MRIWHLLITAVIGILASASAWAQVELKPSAEIHLPVSASRGSFNHFPYGEMDAREHFSFRVAPDQSLLVFDSDASGNWPLIRVKRWWTKTSSSDILPIPGWTTADAKNLDSVNIDVQITPDGRYAVCFAGAYWMEKSAFLLHAPSGYVARKPDTIITVVDLENWKIVKSIHTADVAGGNVEGVRVVNDQWIVSDFSLQGSPLRRLPYRYDSRLISIPDLRSGPQCISDRPFRGNPSLSLGEKDAAPAMQHNDLACKDVLAATRTHSVDALAVLIYRNQDVLPASVQQSSRDLLATEDDFFRSWGEFPYYLLYEENPPFESASHRWYGLYGSHDRDLYNLSIFDSEGRTLKTDTVSTLVCGDPSLDQRRSACGCRVVDVSEQQQDLLAYCRTQRGNYAGMLRREWLSVLHTDNYSGAGVIALSMKDKHETLENFALADGHNYVVTVESGDTLRIYAVPGHE